MKIVLCCRVYPTHRPGGMPFVCQDRAIALATLGEEVHVLTTSHPQYKTPTVIDGVMVHHLPCHSITYSPQFATACAETCKKLRPDLIHCDSFDASAPWYLGFSCKKAVTLHGFSWGGFLTKWNLYRLGRGSQPTFNAFGMKAESEALAKFNIVIGVSRHEYWMLRDTFGLDQAKLVYNPIADKFFTEKPVALPAAKRFLCAAISGHTERMFEVAKQAAAKAGVELVTVSNKSRNDMPAVYDSISALVVPTAYAQGCDLTVAEALARKRPVIASATGSYLKEAEITPWIRLVKMGDVASLQSALLDNLPIVPAHAAEKHQPKVHAKAWLEAVQ